MGKKPKERQRARQRRSEKRAKQKAARSQHTAASRSSVHPMLEMASHWPLHEVWISRDWRDTMQLTQIVVARRSLLGPVFAGTFLVDLACLGVKNAFASIFKSVGEYERDLLSLITRHQKMARADLNLVAKVVREAIAYAHRLGFEPNPDYYDAALALGDADPDACPTQIPLGGEGGKPFFVAGPDDDSDAIIAHLTRRLGPDGFHFMAPIDIETGRFINQPPWEVLPDEEEGDDEPVDWADERQDDNEE